MLGEEDPEFTRSHLNVAGIPTDLEGRIFSLSLDSVQVESARISSPDRRILVRSDEALPMGNVDDFHLSALMRFNATEAPALFVSDSISFAQGLLYSLADTLLPESWLEFRPDTSWLTRSNTSYFKGDSLLLEISWSVERLGPGTGDTLPDSSWQLLPLFAVQTGASADAGESVAAIYETSGTHGLFRVKLPDTLVKFLVSGGDSTQNVDFRVALKDSSTVFRIYWGNAPDSLAPAIRINGHRRRVLRGAYTWDEFSSSNLKLHSGVAESLLVVLPAQQIVRELENLRVASLDSSLQRQLIVVGATLRFALDTAQAGNEMSFPVYLKATLRKDSLDDGTVLPSGTEAQVWNRSDVEQVGLDTVFYSNISSVDTSLVDLDSFFLENLAMSWADYKDSLDVAGDSADVVDEILTVQWTTDSIREQVSWEDNLIYRGKGLADYKKKSEAAVQVTRNLRRVVNLANSGNKVELGFLLGNALMPSYENIPTVELDFSTFGNYDFGAVEDLQFRLELLVLDQRRELP